MKQILLSFFFSLFLVAGFTQSFSDYGVVHQQNSDVLYTQADNKLASAFEMQLMVYPNPATSYIMLKSSKGVKELRIFNLIGRQVINFTDIEKGQTYPVADLPNGMYLVQLIDANNKTLSTHRMNKR